MVYYLVENDDRYSSRQIRGITFKKVGDSDSAATGSYDGLSTKLLEVGEDYNVALRVINYSFVDILADAVKVKLYFQPWIDGGKNYPSADPVGDGYEECGSDVISILGRTAKTDDSDNWGDAEFTFTAPKTPGLGWLHAVVEYEGEELNKDNNHGAGCLSAPMIPRHSRDLPRPAPQALANYRRRLCRRWPNVPISG